MSEVIAPIVAGIIRQGEDVLLVCRQKTAYLSGAAAAFVLRS